LKPVSLADLALGDLALWEGVIRHLYLDTKGYVTIAVGHLLPTASSTFALPLSRANGAPATTAEKRAAWAVVKRLPPGKADAWYASATELRLTFEQCHELARDRLEREFLPRLRERLPGFDGWPISARRATLDIAWNYGTAGLFRTKTLFPQLLANDWRKVAATCEHLSSRPLRNEWRAHRFLEAAA
jgi:GH24 family phage-related lysozyme (muramidase)